MPWTSWRRCTSSTARSATACSPTARRRESSGRAPSPSRTWPATARRPSFPGVGKTLEQKIVDAARHRRDPIGGEAEAKVPALPGRGDQVPGLGAKTARRLYDELGVSSLEELRAAAEQQRIRELKGLGPKAEENVLAALGKLADGAPGERLLLSEVLPVAEQLADDLRAHPASEAVEVAGSARRRTETCKDIDLIATAGEPAALGAGASRPSPGGDQAAPRARAGLGSRPTTGSPSTCGSSRPLPTATCCSTSPARPSTTSSCASEPWRWGSRSPSTGSPTPSTGEVSTLRDRGRGVRAPRPRLHRARAARGQRRDRGRRGGRRCPSWSPWRTSGATSTATPRSPTATTRSRRWPRPRGRAATPTWRSPTTPPATASATTSPRSGCGSGSRR